MHKATGKCEPLPRSLCFLLADSFQIGTFVTCREFTQQLGEGERQANGGKTSRKIFYNWRSQKYKYESLLHKSKVSNRNELVLYFGCQIVEALGLVTPLQLHSILLPVRGEREHTIAGAFAQTVDSPDKAA